MTTALTSNSAALPEITSVRTLVEIRRTQPHYRDIPAPERQTWLAGEITKCNLINHSPKADRDIIKMDTATLDAGILQDKVFADLTLSEISFAMLHGTLGEYGEFYGLTARAYLGFLREFLRTDLKEWAAHEERKALAPPEKGAWVLERMEHHRQQVEREWRERENQAVPENREEGWKKHIETILNTKNTQTPKR